MKKEYKFQFLLFVLMLILISLVSSKIYFRLDTTKKLHPVKLYQRIIDES